MPPIGAGNPRLTSVSSRCGDGVDAAGECDRGVQVGVGGDVLDDGGECATESQDSTAGAGVQVEHCGTDLRDDVR